eukprot:4076597-Amphidinium_carterae.1
MTNTGGVAGAQASYPAEQADDRDDAAPIDGVGQEASDAQPCFQCTECDFTSRSNAGLQAHRRRSHNRHSDLSLRVSPTSCEACHLPFGKRWQVLDHLQNSKRCALYSLDHVQPLTPTSLERMLKQ